MPVNTPTLLRTRPTLGANEACVTFVAAAQLMLAPETLRREVEPRLLAQLPTLRALGVFDLFELRDPALRAWLADELAELGGGGARA